MSSGRYLYCIIPGYQQIDFGAVGIDGMQVYGISQGDLTVLIHNCEAKPYDSADEKKIAGWVLTHEKVTVRAMDEFGAVLPLRFNTIIQGENDQEVDRQVKKWIEDDHDILIEKLKKLKGKSEYGVQISWDMEVVSNEIMGEDVEIKGLAKDIEKMSEGLAYMNRQKLENLLKRKLEEKADIVFKQYYSSISDCVDEVKIERTKRVQEPKQMIMNLSCLTTDTKTLSAELDKIEKSNGFFVRFTGPWPPYSFVEG
ncbi:MAG: GvpL/GvpF family gas vesicle protein [Bacteroidetes bacterium]|nr:GvpL/GvpF family gas vesicle protein [Bacteroidota bacterium]